MVGQMNLEFGINIGEKMYFWCLNYKQQICRFGYIRSLNL